MLHDEPGRYYLNTHERRAKDGYVTAFGGVEIKRNYVSAHVFALYLHPEMKGALSGQLLKRMQGKTCFNFKAVDTPLFAELDELIDAGAARMRADGRIG